MFKQCVAFLIFAGVLCGCQTSQSSVSSGSISGISGGSQPNVSIVESTEGIGRKRSQQCRDEMSSVPVDDGTAIISGRSCTLSDAG